MSNSYDIPIFKTITTTIPHGTVELVKVADSYKVFYHNSIYKNSPFECPTTFSISFTPKEIVNSREVMKFISGITGESPNPIC